MDESGSSISVVLSQDFEQRLENNLDIKPKTPIVDVPKVQPHSFGDVFDRWCCASGTIALRPAGYSWFDVMSKGVVAQDSFEIVVMGQGMRTRAYQRHVPQQHIHELRQFIDAR